MTHLEAHVIGHRHHAARGVAGAEIAVDIGLGEACVFQCALGDFGMKLCGGFIGCMPGWMLVNSGEIGFALDTQVVLRWRFFFASVFSPFGAGLASAPAVKIAKGNPATRNADMRPWSRGAFAPEVSQKFPYPPDQRAQGIPGARCTRGLVCKSAQKKRTRAYRFSGGNPAFPAQWPYGLCRALPGESGFVVSVASRKSARNARSGFSAPPLRLDANR